MVSDGFVNSGKLLLVAAAAADAVVVGVDISDAGVLGVEAVVTVLTDGGPA